MLTQKDIEILKSELAKEFATKDDLRAHSDKILEVLDGVVGELKTIREEQVFHQSQHDRIDNEIDTIKTHVNLPTS